MALSKIEPWPAVCIERFRRFAGGIGDVHPATASAFQGCDRSQIVGLKDGQNPIDAHPVDGLGSEVDRAASCARSANDEQGYPARGWIVVRSAAVKGT